MDIERQPYTNWRTRDLLFAGLVAVVAFAVAFALGSGLILASGIPGLGGVGNIFAAVFLLVLSYEIAPRPFFGTLVLSLLFAIAIPTTIGGPIGPLKVVNGLVIGLIFDGICWLGGRRKYAVVLAAGIASVVSLLGVYLGLVMLDLPAVERLRPLLVLLSVVQLVLGASAAGLALRTYRRRLAVWPSIRRFQGEP